VAHAFLVILGLKEKKKKKKKGIPLVWIVVVWIVVALRYTVGRVK